MNEQRTQVANAIMAAALRAVPIVDLDGNAVPNNIPTPQWDEVNEESKTYFLVLADAAIEAITEENDVD